MAITHWYYLLLPLLVLAVMSLLRFRGCRFRPGATGTPDQYGTAVMGDGPIAWFRLEEAPGATTATNAAGSPNGTYGTAPSPLSAGNASWHSAAVASTELTLGINNPDLVPLESQDPYDFSIRVAGAYVQVPADATSLQNLTEFTLEGLVYPDWDTTVLGNYYCVLELAAQVSPPMGPPATMKNQGFGLYAGPSDTTNPKSSYSWQVWMGNGTSFQRLEEMKPYTPNGSNPGPNVEKDQPTYLAVTYSQSQGQAFLYLYTADRDLDYVAYQLIFAPYTPVTSAANTQGLHIGLTGQGPLFSPPPPAFVPFLYPFIGQMCNIAIYNKVLTQDELRNHATVAFFVNSPST
jgi:hypothetical protein